MKHFKRLFLVLACFTLILCTGCKTETAYYFYTNVPSDGQTSLRTAVTANFRRCSICQRRFGSSRGETAYYFYTNVPSDGFEIADKNFVLGGIIEGYTPPEVEYPEEDVESFSG